jgi:alcohol dehydrogenase
MIPKYYEFSNKIRILSGYRALENIPHELKARCVSRPMIITRQDKSEQGILKLFLSAMSGSELVIGSVLQCEPDVSENLAEQALSEFKESSCDSIIALGSSPSFQLAKAVCNKLSFESSGDILLFGTDAAKKIIPAPFIFVPVENIGIEINGDPDIVVLDPRMTLKPGARDVVLSAIDTICHAIETYTCLQKNPVSDAYAFSALTLVRENLESAVRHQWDKNAKHAVANAALLSSIAFKNSQAGIVHALSYGLEKHNRLRHEEAVAIVLPRCMEVNMIKLDEYYGELLLPLAGPEVFSDTPREQRGRKFLREIRNMLMEYHDKFDIPVCLSEAGVKRSDFGNIAEFCLKSSHLLFDPSEVTEEAVQNILNMSF